MTTNRMGLEQESKFTNESMLQFRSAILRGERMASGEFTIAIIDELLARRKASSEPVADVVAWNKQGEERKCDIRWRRFDVAPGPLFEATPLQDVKVPDKATWRDAPVNSENVDWAAGWNACRALMLKSVTNEP